VKINVLLEGQIHTGKTTALRTLLPVWIDNNKMEHRGAGLSTFVVSLDPGIDASLGPNLCDGGATVRSLVAPIHYHYIPQRPMDSEAAKAWAARAHNMTTDNLIKFQDPDRNKYTQFLDLYELIDDLVCAGCAQHFGSIFKLGPEWAIALDGCTGLTNIARTNHVGSRPALSLPEYGTIMGSIETFMDLWWGNTLCSAVLIAHVERENDPLTGLSYITTSTIGQKLAPRLDKKPDDVILTERIIDQKGVKYVWNTAEKGMTLKSRHLPLRNDLPADFSQMFKT